MERRISNRKIDESIQSAPCEESEQSIGRVLNKSENATNKKIVKQFGTMGLSIIYYMINYSTTYCLIFT